MQAPTTGGDAPAWLVDLVMTPPWWALAALVVATIVTLALAARRVYGRDFYIARDEQREMLLLLGTAEGVAVGVIATMRVANLPFIADVVVGVVSGFVVVELLRRVDGPLPGDGAAHIAAGWAVVGVGAFALPGMAAGGLTTPPGLDIALGSVAALMFFWTVMQEYGPGETLGDIVREGAADD